MGFGRIASSDQRNAESSRSPNDPQRQLHLALQSPSADMWSTLGPRLLPFSVQWKTTCGSPLRPLAVRVQLGNVSLTRPGPFIPCKAQGDALLNLQRHKHRALQLRVVHHIVGRNGDHIAGGTGNQCRWRRVFGNCGILIPALNAGDFSTPLHRGRGHRQRGRHIQRRQVLRGTRGHGIDLAAVWLGGPAVSAKPSPQSFVHRRRDPHLRRSIR